MFGHTGRYTILWACIICILSVLPASHPENIGSIPFVDKLAHILIYAIMAFLMMRDFGAAAKNRKSISKRYIFAFFSAIIFGISMEIVQFFLPYRSFEMVDIAANATGALVGLAIFFMFYHRRIAENK